MTKKIMIVVSALVVVMLTGTYLIFKTAEEGHAQSVMAYSKRIEHVQTMAEARGELQTEKEQAAEERQVTEEDLQQKEQIQKIINTTGLDYESSKYVLQYAKKFNLKPSLLLAMMRVESNFHQYAVGKSQDRGYFQIIPPSEKAIAVKWGKEVGLTYDPERIFDPEYNIGLAATYINQLQKKHKGDLHKILTEYNRGPSKMKAYYEENGTYETPYSQKVISAEKKYANSLS